MLKCFYCGKYMKNGDSYVYDSLDTNISHSSCYDKFKDLEHKTINYQYNTLKKTWNNFIQTVAEFLTIK